MLKKIMLLGGSEQQIVAITTAKKMGYYTILCDYLPDNPGQYHADKFYQVSTTDKMSILEVAKNEKIDGIVAYASDPAAPTAAFVSEKLGLSTNPYDSVEILCNKNKFREFLKNNGFNSPKTYCFETVNEAKSKIDEYEFPIIVKPVDSSGSKGVTVLYDSDKLDNAIEFALSFSRCKKVVIESFIEKKHSYLIGGDIFVLSGKIEIWGLMNCHRDSNVNSLVPVGKSYPSSISDSDMKNVKITLQNLVDKLEIKNGAMNVEVIIDKNDDVWLIDIGPRNGGNMIPDLLGYIFNIDVIEMTIKCAMGEIINFKPEAQEVFFATHNLHTNKNGIFKEIEFSEELEKYIFKKCIYKKDGDFVEYFNNSAKALGIVFLKFNSKNEMMDIMEKVNDFIKIKLEEGELYE